MTSARQIRFWLIGIVLFVLALYLLRGILLPFVAGMAIAYFLDPACDRLERAGLSRTLATTVVTVLFALVLIAALIVIVPMLQGQIVELVSRLPEYLEALQQRLQPLLIQLERNLKPEDPSRLREAISGQAGTIVAWAGGAVAGLISGGLALANILSLIFITPVVAFYLLRDWDKMMDRVDSWLPREHAAVIREQARQIDHTMAGWVRGQATVCLLLGIYYSVGLSIIGLDFGLAIGLLTGILSFVPFVGTITGFVLSVVVALSQYTAIGPVAGIIAFFIAGQVIEGNFLTPKLVGDRVGLHPVWVIFALLAGGALFGFVGILLALPIAAMIGVLTRFALSNYLESRYYQPPGEAIPPTELEPGGDDLPPSVA